MARNRQINKPSEIVEFAKDYIGSSVAPAAIRNVNLDNVGCAVYVVGGVLSRLGINTNFQADICDIVSLMVDALKEERTPELFNYYIANMRKIDYMLIDAMVDAHGIVDEDLGASLNPLLPVFAWVRSVVPKKADKLALLSGMTDGELEEVLGGHIDVLMARIFGLPTGKCFNKSALSEVDERDDRGGRGIVDTRRN